MKTVAETSYAFISNDLRGPNLRSLDPTCSESSESDRVRNQVDDRYHGPELPKHIYSQPVRIENGRQNLPPIKGPAERKIRGQSSISRLRNSLSSDAIKLMLLRPNVQTPQNHEVCSRSRDSSPSSSSSYPFSPSCEWNVPLLRKFRRAKSAQRLDAHKQPDLSGVVGLPATGLDPFRNTVTTIPPIKSTALFTQKAKQVWTALERKFSHLHKLPESQSTGNLRHSAPLREKTLEQSARYNTDLCLGQTGCELPGHLCQICWARFQQHLCSEHPVKATEGLTCLVPNTNRKLATIHTHNPNRPVRDWRQHSHCVIGEPGSKDLHGYAIHRFSNHINAQCLQVGDPLSRPSRSVCGSCDEGEASRREACNVSAVSAPNELKQTPHNQSAHPVYFVCKNNPLQETRELLIARREIGERYGMRVETTAQGVYLTTVIRGSPAAHAGLKVGDELLQLNGFPLGQLSAQTIMEMIRSTPQSLRIVYRPRTMLPRFREVSVQKIDGRVGIRLKSTNEGLFVDVVLPCSAASQAGIKVGDQLIRVNDQPMDGWTQDAASQFLRDLPDGEQMIICVRDLLPVNSCERPTNTLSGRPLHRSPKCGCFHNVSCDSKNGCYTEQCRKCLSNLSQSSPIYEKLHPEFLTVITSRTEHTVKNPQLEHTPNPETSDTNEYMSLRLVNSLSERTLRCHDSQHPEDY